MKNNTEYTDGLWSNWYYNTAWIHFDNEIIWKSVSGIWLLNAFKTWPIFHFKVQEHYLLLEYIYTKCITHLFFNILWHFKPTLIADGINSSDTWLINWSPQYDFVVNNLHLKQVVNEFEYILVVHFSFYWKYQ